MNACCAAAGNRKTPALVRPIPAVFAWFLPCATLMLVPKCPACLAAYLTLWTGLGLSLVAAAYLRWALLFLCVASLIFLILARLVRTTAIFRDFKMETKACNTQS